MSDGDAQLRGGAARQLRAHAGQSALLAGERAHRDGDGGGGRARRDRGGAAPWAGAAGRRRGDAAFGKQLADWAALAAPRCRQTPAPTDPEMQKWQEQELEQKAHVLRVVNRLWAQAGHKFREAYLQAAAATTIARRSARSTSTRRPRRRAWPSTSGWRRRPSRRSRSCSRGTIPSDTKLVITNAVYFKAHWDEEFNASLTKDEPFFVAGGKQVKAPLMSRTASYRIARIDGAMMAELPYGEGRLVMDVVLPTREGRHRQDRRGLRQGRARQVGGGAPSVRAK